MNAKLDVATRIKLIRNARTRFRVEHDAITKYAKALERKLDSIIRKLCRGVLGVEQGHGEVMACCTAGCLGPKVWKPEIYIRTLGDFDYCRRKWYRFVPNEDDYHWVEEAPPWRPWQLRRFLAMVEKETGIKPRLCDDLGVRAQVYKIGVGGTPLEEARQEDA